MDKVNNSYILLLIEEKISQISWHASLKLVTSLITSSTPAIQVTGIERSSNKLSLSNLDASNCGDQVKFQNLKPRMDARIHQQNRCFVKMILYHVK